MVGLRLSLIRIYLWDGSLVCIAVLGNGLWIVVFKGWIEICVGG